MSTSKDQQNICSGCGKDFATSDRSNFCCNTISGANEMGIAITSKGPRVQDATSSPSSSCNTQSEQRTKEHEIPTSKRLRVRST